MQNLKFLSKMNVKDRNFLAIFPSTDVFHLLQT